MTEQNQSNVAVLDIENRAVDKINMPTNRGSRVSKYEETFDALELGQCLKVVPKSVPNIKQALVKYLKRKEAFDQVKIVTRTKCEDGYGRIWVLSKEDDAAGQEPAQAQEHAA